MPKSNYKCSDENQVSIFKWRLFRKHQNLDFFHIAFYVNHFRNEKMWVRFMLALAYEMTGR